MLLVGATAIGSPLFTRTVEAPTPPPENTIVSGITDSNYKTIVISYE